MMCRKIDGVCKKATLILQTRSILTGRKEVAWMVVPTLCLQPYSPIAPSLPSLVTATNPSHLSLAKVISTNTHVNRLEGKARKECCRGNVTAGGRCGGGRSIVLLSVVPVYNREQRTIRT
jgi:hypothetical protein